MPAGTGKSTNNLANIPKATTGSSKAVLNAQPTSTTTTISEDPQLQQQHLQFGQVPGEPQRTLENTFKTKPDKKFIAGPVKNILDALMQEKLKGVVYSGEKSPELCKELINEAMKRIKGLGYERYKFIVECQIMESKGQGVRSASRCLWDSSTDGCTSSSFKSKQTNNKSPVSNVRPLDLEHLSISKNDIECAFKFFSQNGKVVTHDDLKLKLERYFGKLSLQDYKLLFPADQRDPIPVKSHRPFAGVSPTDFIHLLDPTGTGYVDEIVLKQLVSTYNLDQKGKNSKVILRYDKQSLLEEFDYDGDGIISINDFLNANGLHKAKKEHGNGNGNGGAKSK